jgi:hypothetical protein
MSSPHNGVHLNPDKMEISRAPALDDSSIRYGKPSGDTFS